MQEIHKISSETAEKGWEISKPDKDFTNTSGYVRGPIRLGAPSGDYLWEYSYENFSIMLRKDTSTIKTSIYNKENLVESSVSFDADGSYTIAYKTASGDSYIKEGQSLIKLEGFITTPRVVYCKSFGIIVYYIKNGRNMYFRSKSLNFKEEFFMGVVGEASIKRVGVDISNRIRFLLETLA